MNQPAKLKKSSNIETDNFNQDVEIIDVDELLQYSPKVEARLKFDKKDDQPNLRKIKKTPTELRTEALFKTLSSFEENLTPEESLAMAQAFAEIVRYRIGKNIPKNNRPREKYIPKRGKGTEPHRAVKFALEKYSEELKYRQISQADLDDKIDGDPSLVTGLKNATKSIYWGSFDTDLKKSLFDKDIKLPIQDLNEFLISKATQGKLETVMSFIDSILTRKKPKN